jgi:CMP-N-acetylneuraminic acid synthetase
LLQPTSPLRKTKHIDEAIEMLIQENLDSVVSVSEPMEHPGDMVYWNTAGRMKFLLETVPSVTQRQQYDKCLFLNGAIYAFTYECVLKNNSRFGEKSLPYLMPQIDSIDIDSPDDMRIAEAILQNRYER